MESRIRISREQVVPMTLGEYNSKKGWILPSNEFEGEAGYFVTRADNSTTWVNKTLYEGQSIVYNENNNILEYPNFEKPHQQRVVEEVKELSEKFSKLWDFTEDPNEDSLFNKLDLEERKRLEFQLDIMSAYITILDERIKNFK